MASPLETYIKKLQRNDALSNVSLPGGVVVYDKEAERKKITNEYLSSLPKRPDAPEFRLIESPSRGDRRNRQQNQAMDNKIVEEGKIMNQFDMARGLGGREGIEKIKEIAENTPGGVNIFNKMNEGSITFNELMGALGNPKNLPYKPSETDMMQMENLIVKNGMMPDDIRANPAMAKVFNSSQKLQSLAQRNVDSMLRREEEQIAINERDKERKRQIAMDEAAYMDEMMRDPAFYGPGLDTDKVNLLAKDFVKYGDDNLMQISSLLGSDKENKLGGELAYLNIRSKLGEAGASEQKLKEYDSMYQGSKIKNMEMDLEESMGSKAYAKMNRTPKQIMDDRLMASMEPKKVQSKSKVPKQRKQPLRSLLTRATLEGQKFASAIKDDDSWKKLVQTGGYIGKKKKKGYAYGGMVRPDGKQGYFLGGLATALAPAAITAIKSGVTADASSGGGMLKNVMGALGGMKDKYVSNPIAAGKLENLMEDGTDEATARRMRDEDDMGKADFTTALARGGKEFVKDSVAGVGTGLGVLGAGLKGGKELLMDKNKASFEDLASGKAKGSLLQRLGKGLNFAGNAINVMNADDPSSAMIMPDVKFSSGQGNEKVQSLNLNSNVNEDLTVKGDDEKPYNPPLAGENNVNTDDRLNNADNTRVDFNRQVGDNSDLVNDMIAPIEKAKTIEDVKNMSDADIKNIQSSLGITVDGKVGPETTNAFNNFIKNKEVTKQDGGFISGLMQYQMGGYV